MGRPPEGCGKVRYGSEARAMRALEAIVETRRQLRHVGKNETRAYACEDCGWWHLTAQPPRHRGQQALTIRPHAGSDPDEAVPIEAHTWSIAFTRAQEYARRHPRARRHPHNPIPPPTQ